MVHVFFLICILYTYAKAGNMRLPHCIYTTYVTKPDPGNPAFVSFVDKSRERVQDTLVQFSMGNCIALMSVRLDNPDAYSLLRLIEVYSKVI